jgi:hypothetical protein
VLTAKLITKLLGHGLRRSCAAAKQDTMPARDIIAVALVVFVFAGADGGKRA